MVDVWLLHGAAIEDSEEEAMTLDALIIGFLMGLVVGGTASGLVALWLVKDPGACPKCGAKQ